MADNYKVTSQRPTSVLGPDGRFHDVVEITFTTKSGDPGTLRVSTGDYKNLDYVKQELNALAMHMESVKNL